MDHLLYDPPPPAMPPELFRLTSSVLPAAKVPAGLKDETDSPPALGSRPQ
jgi:hypothetical protein